MRRALPALGLTGAGLALVLSFRTTPPNSAGAVLASPPGPTTGAGQTIPPQGGFSDRGGFRGGDDNQPVQPGGPPTSTQPQSSTGSGSSSGTGANGGAAAGGLKDGTFDGTTVNTRYGPVQVEVTVQGSKVTDVEALQTPNDRFRSVAINSQAAPMLRQEALRAQNAQINIVSGATITSEAYAKSLQAALDRARATG
jgi:uncharacterized protein with FMN-binding domain